MIAQTVLDNIRSQTNIVDVISEFVSLEQKGHDYIASCPFLDHTDDSPSFSVSETKQIYKCFGCGKGGNVFTFLQEYQRMSFTDAVEFCAQRVGIKVEYDNNRDRLDLLLELHEKACRSFTTALSEQDVYLSIDRQLKLDIIKQFRLGFDNGKFKASVSSDYQPDILFDSGLFSKSEKGIIDRWTNRYTFSLIDTQGKVIGFAGTNKGVQPKYINSSETKLYNKSTFLFGLYQARNAIIRSKGVIVVEGYFDCLSLVQAGFKNTVAICGTALTSQHGKLLSRYCKEVVLLFDNDEGGIKAIDHSIPGLFEHGITVYIAQCDAGCDPDDLVKDQGRSGVVKVLKKAESWFDFRLKYNSTVEKMKKVGIVKEVADKIESVDRRSLFLDLCADHLNINRNSLTTKSHVNYKKNSLPEFVLDYTTELVLLASMHVNPEVSIDISREIFDEDVRLVSLYDAVTMAKGVDSALYNNLNTEQAEIMTSIMAMSGKNVDILGAMKSVLKVNIRKKIKVLIEKIAQCEIKGGDCIELTEKLNYMIAKQEGVLNEN